MSESPTKAKRIWRHLRAPLLLYVGVCLLMMALESMLVYPRPSSAGPHAWKLSQESQFDVSFEAEDGTQLHGWFFAHENPQFAVLYCHGNGEDISRNAVHMDFLREKLQASIFAFDYRGYGKSAGSPHEAGLILDGLAAQRWLAQKMQLETEEIVIIGRSLGGGVAVAIAEQQGARALVLQNTFANLYEVAANRFFWLPVRWMMRNRYPSTERIKAYRGPILQTHGTADRVVPYAQGQQLFSIAPGTPKQWIPNEGLGHNQQLPLSYYDTLTEFLHSLPE
ncbi:MAG: alpha/beta hydrolase [Bythopirellula sp.]